MNIVRPTAEQLNGTEAIIEGALNPIVQTQQTNPAEAGATDPAKSNESAAAPDINQILQEHLGADWGSLDKLKTIPEQLARLSQLTEENTNLQNRVKGAENPWANERVALFNSFVKETGIENYGLFDRISTFDPKAADPVDVLILADQMKDPSLVGKETALRALFNRKFPVDPASVAAEDVEINQLELQRAAREATQAILQAKEKIRVQSPEDRTARLQKERDDLTGAWTTALPTRMEELTSFDLFTQGEKDEKPEKAFSYVVTPEMRKELTDQTLQVMVQNNLPATEENFALAKSHAKNMLVLKHLPRMLSAYKTELLSEFTKNTDKAIHNPSGLKPNNDTPGGRDTVPDTDFRKQLSRAK